MKIDLKKFLPYIFITTLLIGFFLPIKNTHAQVNSDSYGKCWKNAHIIGTSLTEGSGTNGKKIDEAWCTQFGGKWQAPGAQMPAEPYGQKPGYNEDGSKTETPKTEFENQVKDKTCYVLNITGACLLKLVYYGLYVTGGWLLWLSAYFFNTLIAISINGAILKSPVINTAWTVVRDLSNLFFILILLYIAIQTILGIGHGTKQMIAKVLLMALLINFSLFFTKVIIDTSNVIASVFYQKLAINTVRPDGTPIPYKGTTGNNEKDLAGAMVNSFNPTKLLDLSFFEKVKIELDSPNEVPTNVLTGITLVAAALMLFAAYAFFVVGISFLGRLIELFVLMIFSPFAFMSSSLPLLGHVEYLGWDAWFKRLISVSFMAPVFMFFMYFIFLLIKENLFAGILTLK
jgi:hypothetical protein